MYLQFQLIMITLSYVIRVKHFYSRTANKKQQIGFIGQTRNENCIGFQDCPRFEPPLTSPKYIFLCIEPRIKKTMQVSFLLHLSLIFPLPFVIESV